MNFKKLFSKSNNRGSEFVEALLTFPLLVMIIFSVAYAVLYFNAKGNAQDTASFLARNVITTQKYCELIKNGNSYSYDEENTLSNHSLGRTIILDALDSDEFFDTPDTKCYLALETYETKTVEEVTTTTKKVYYDFFGYEHPSINETNYDGEGPEAIANNWKIGNFVNLTLTTGVFKTGTGISLFEAFTSINFFDGVAKIEIISSKTTVTARFQIENDACDDINLSDDEKPSICIEE